MQVRGNIIYHMLGSYILMGLVTHSMQVHFGWVNDSFQALAFCASTGPDNSILTS